MINVLLIINFQFLNLYFFPALKILISKDNKTTYLSFTKKIVVFKFHFTYFKLKPVFQHLLNF